MSHAVALAAIAGIFQQPHFRMLAGKTSYQLGRGVARAIVDDQDFRRPTFTRRVRKNLFQAGRKPLAFVVGGNNDAVLHEQLRRPGAARRCELRVSLFLNAK